MGTKTCKQCGKSWDDKVKFCSYCGSDQFESFAQTSPVTMFCKSCGTKLQPDNQTFCPKCGARTDGTQPAQKVYSNNSTSYPMNWFKFLIYFALIAGAVLSALSGILQLTGLQYYISTLGRVSAKRVYGYYDGLQVVDIIYGLLLLGYAAFAIVTRISLAKYKKNGPKMLIILYALTTVPNVLHEVATGLIMRTFNASGLGAIIGTILGSAIATAIVIVLNSIYFTKRKELFVN